MANQAILSGSPSAHGPGFLGRQLKRNPEAVKFLRDWMRMRAEQKTDWSFAAVHRYVVQEHQIVASRMGLMQWLEKHHREEFAKARGAGV
jgi:hypothetical protein